ncbi:amylo-alpha-1,6-glucosidase [Microbacterium sp. 22296]|uniref:amylo-alpha-1,6-glucosidase n=1 Tax=Microbacterium sp. 22296 TaxID=3453903 RepID=UPI003F877F63
MTSSTLPSFDVREIPFSYRGSWMNLSPVIGLHAHSEHVHLVSHVTGMHAVLRLVPTLSGEVLPAVVEADPAVLTWRVNGRVVARAVFESGDVIRLSGDAGEFTIADAAEVLTPFSGSYFFRAPSDGAFVFTSYETGRRYRITVLTGTGAARGAEALGDDARALTLGGDGAWEVAIQQIESAAVPYATTESFDAVAERVATEFSDYLGAVAGWRTGETPAATLAAYTLWSATVAPAGFLTRESVLMSKHWMDKVWSWDHCFNALALAPGLPDLALDQFLTPFDHQDAAGAMPDSVTHSEVLYNFVKPPIHGWAFQRLRERLGRPLTRDELETVYGHLVRWSRFWLDHRTSPGRALPSYEHGNDSGWDNATTFDHDRVIEAPDLAAFLVIQLDVVAELADELGLDGDLWRAERDRVQQALLAELRDTEGFFAVGGHSRRESKRTSLLTLLPVLASDRFPAEVGTQLAEQIAHHLTSWGPATQLIGTPEYESDGYWRGPIWAPSTMIIEEGLRRGGHVALADTVNQRFRALCEESGFAENFDAITGEGLRDRAYTWTASVYLVFADDHVRRSGSRPHPEVEVDAVGGAGTGVGFRA